jgi:hypothetical protein
MNMFQHIYWAVRYGDWAWAWESYPGKPWFNANHCYYDGNWATLHIYKFWISVHY